MIVVDARYYGNALMVGRKNARLSRADVAQMLGLTPREYGRIETGKALISQQLLHKLMSYVFVAMLTRYSLDRSGRMGRVAKKYAKRYAVRSGAATDSDGQ